MIPAAFDYLRADSAEAALAALAEHGDEAKLLAGGHSLLPLMKLRLATPAVLVDIGRITDLAYIRPDGDEIAIGALTRHRDVETSDVLDHRGPAARPRCGAGRRSPGPAPRHHRRIDRPRRPGVRSPGRAAGPRRDAPHHRAGEVLGSSPPPTSSRASSKPRSLRTSSSPRSASLGFPGRAGRSRSSTAEPRTGRSSASRRCSPPTDPGSDWSTWARLRCPRPPPKRPCRSGASAADAAELAAEGTQPPADLNASEEFRGHLARVLTRRALDEAMVR